MARLVNVWRDDDPVELASKQMPLIVDENLTVRARARARVFTSAPARTRRRFPSAVDRRGSWGTTATSLYVTERPRSTRDAFNLKHARSGIRWEGEKKRATRSLDHNFWGPVESFVNDRAAIVCCQNVERTRRRRLRDGTRTTRRLFSHLRRAVRVFFLRTILRFP